MSRSARQAAPLAAVVAATVSAGAFLSACGAASSPDPAQPVGTVTVTASNSDVASPPASSGPTRSPAPPSSPAAPTSTASPVSTVAPAPPGASASPAQQGTAGSAYQVIILANVSGKTCALYGYPGVSFVSGIGGSQIGKDAARDRA